MPTDTPKTLLIIDNSLKKLAKERAKQLGIKSFSEYVRHLIRKDNYIYSEEE